jgi:glycosyltransferase involved in cell wall biosynthesis
LIRLTILHRPNRMSVQVELSKSKRNTPATIAVLLSVDVPHYPKRWHMAKVDVIVPCYNYGRFLEACVRSVLEQSMGDLQVLIIDDASSDNSLLVATKLAEGDRRVSVIAHSQNCGHISTYNQGIAWASADYFLLLSADDLLVPGALERATEVMDANPDIVLTYGKSMVWYDNVPFPKIDPDQTYMWTRHDLIGEICGRCSNPVPTPTALARTSTQKAVGGYRAFLPHAGDMEMWLRFAAHGAVATIHAVQAITRMHSSNMSTSYYAPKLPDFQQRKQAFETFFKEYSDCVPDSGTLRCRVLRILAEKAFWSGIIQLCRGRIDSGRLLLRFSFNLEPNLRYRPPLRRGPSAFAGVAGRLLGRGKRALLRGRRALLLVLKAWHMALRRNCARRVGRADS